MPGGFEESSSRILKELKQVFDRIDPAAVRRLIAAIHDSPAVFCAAAGRSGMLLRSAAMRLMHLGKRVFVVGEIVTPAIARGDVLLIVSGSGETDSLKAMAKKAKAMGADVLLVTTNAGSSLAGIADVVVVVPAPSPKVPGENYVESTQPMGNLFEQSAYLLLDAVVMELMAMAGITSEEMFARHANLE